MTGYSKIMSKRASAAELVSKCGGARERTSECSGVEKVSFPKLDIEKELGGRFR